MFSFKTPTDFGGTTSNFDFVEKREVKVTKE
jgi:hypothetical protein